MKTQPILYTSRLTLRPFLLSDSPRVQELAGDCRISEMAVNIPYPYTDGMAENWISSHPAAFSARERIVYAVTISATDELIGTVSLTQIVRAEGNLGYWIGVPYWGRGYCTEAVASLLEFAFTDYGLEMIYARHLVENQASGRVIRKNGFSHCRTVCMDIRGKNRSLEHYEKRS